MIIFILLITLLLALACFAKKMPDSMVLVEGGTFEMGGDDEFESPAHQVTISSFYICKHQIMQKEWRAVMGYNPSRFTGTFDNLPVELVTWYEAVEFCNKLSELAGLTPVYTIDEENVTCDWSANGYRLPTEAEWEYAARGGKKSKGYTYSGSNKIDEVAWYAFKSNNNKRELYDENFELPEDDKCAEEKEKQEDYYENRKHYVGKKASNELGIYDMSGNVWEWCYDWYDLYYYHNSPKNDPKGPDSGSDRVIRGGSWQSQDTDCRVTLRFFCSPDYYDDVTGFRVVRTR